MSIAFWKVICILNMTKKDFQNAIATKPIQGFDLTHQLVRLKTVKNLPDAEVDLIMRTLVENVQTYDQVVEVCKVLSLTHLNFAWMILKTFHQYIILLLYLSSPLVAFSTASVSWRASSDYFWIVPPT